MHRLLERQLRRHFGGADKVPPEWSAFLDAVDAAYREADEDRALLERSMEISSKELVERYAELRASSASLKAANDRLRDLDRFRTQFINNAAHELGTPLTPIKIQMHLLRKALAEGTPERAEEVKRVLVLERNLERLADLARDILDAARLQASRLELGQAPVDMSELARETVESFSDAAGPVGVSLESHVDPRLSVLGDRRRLGQVLFNLVGNALKFTPPGGRVVVRVASTPDEVVVRVEDDGIGLRPADAERLFQPFVQVNESVRPGDHGTGLGLYISKGIVEACGGRIWCASEGPGLGSTFAFSLPRAHGSGAQSQALAGSQVEPVSGGAAVHRDLHET